MYEKILIPIDLAHTEKADQSIQAASKLAGKNTSVKLVNVIEDLPVFVAAELPGGVIEQAKQSAVSKLTAMASAVGKNAKTEIRSGTVYRSILSAAEEWGADIIVVGSHKPGAQDYFLGSTASRVVRHAKCPVLVIR